MAFQTPTFISRLLRPFTTSTKTSLQPDSLSTKSFPPSTQRAIVAGGCFWGVEELYRKHFPSNTSGLLDLRVGYTGGSTAAPSYRAVCSGSTGHAEALLLLFDPDKLSYKEIVTFFFKMHDPTTLNRQGADTGTQYRSAIFATTDEQLKEAEEIKEKVGKEWYKGKKISTEVKMAGPWFDAEDYHQDYLGELEKKGQSGYQCPAHYMRKFPDLST